MDGIFLKFHICLILIFFLFFFFLLIYFLVVNIIVLFSHHVHSQAIIVNKLHSKKNFCIFYLEKWIRNKINITGKLCLWSFWIYESFLWVLWMLTKTKHLALLFIYLFIFIIHLLKKIKNTKCEWNHWCGPTRGKNKK